MLPDVHWSILLKQESFNCFLAQFRPASPPDLSSFCFRVDPPEARTRRPPLPQKSVMLSRFLEMPLELSLFAQTTLNPLFICHKPRVISQIRTMSSGKQLVVFDFDWSFVDQDTDRFVLEVLSTKLRRKLQTIKAGGSQCTPDVV